MTKVIYDAEYSPASLPEHAGNPLIEALPPYVEAEELMKTFGRFPVAMDSDRDLPRAMRIQAVCRLNEYLLPLPRHYDVVDNIGTIIRNGYQFRNPSNSEYRKKLAHERYHRAMSGAVTPIEESEPSSAPAFALFGVSGVGKTTVIERTLTYLPQVLCHRDLKILQLVYIKAECPYRGNLSNFLRLLINDANRFLDMKLPTTGNIGDLMVRVASLVQDHHLGLIWIDEVQNLLSARGTGDRELLNWFVKLSNLKVPICLSGTPKALHFFSTTFREARRVGDYGCLVWDRLQEGREWDYFIEDIWNYQWTKEKITYSEQLGGLMYKLTQGILALAVRLFQLSQLEAIRNKEEKLSEKSINNVYKDKMTLVHRVIEELQKKHHGNISKYEDLLDRGVKDLQTQVDTEARLNALDENKYNSNQKTDHQIRATAALVNMDFEASAAERLVSDLFAVDDTMTATKAVGIILQRTDSSSIYKRRRKGLGTSAESETSEPLQRETAAKTLRKKGILATRGQN